MSKPKIPKVISERIKTLKKGLGREKDLDKKRDISSKIEELVYLRDNNPHLDYMSHYLVLFDCYMTSVFCHCCSDDNIVDALSKLGLKIHGVAKWPCDCEDTNDMVKYVQDSID